MKTTKIKIRNLFGITEENREKLYSKCREKRIQFIATRTTDSTEMEVNYLDQA